MLHLPPLQSSCVVCYTCHRCSRAVPCAALTTSQLPPTDRPQHLPPVVSCPRLTVYSTCPPPWPPVPCIPWYLSLAVSRSFRRFTRVLYIFLLHLIHNLDFNLSVCLICSSFLCVLLIYIRFSSFYLNRIPHFIMYLVSCNI